MQRERNVMTTDGDGQLMRMVDRMRAAGMTDEAIIAAVIIDCWVIDRMKVAGRLGLADPAAEDASRRWVRAEMAHAVQFGMQIGNLSADDLRAELEAALVENIADVA